ncbi:MAG: chemotaxis response regulator protein-glutamate methylesterase [Syntrophales bacterium]
MKKLRILVVDDSPLMLAWLKKIFLTDPEVGEVLTAPDAYEAKTILEKIRPDVITLDVEMPGMNGVTFLKEIMASRPLPVVMVSAYTRENCQATIEALSLGAIDFIPKPGPGSLGERETFPERILKKVKEAANSQIMVTPSFSHKPLIQSHQVSTQKVRECIIGIGASTGGTQALQFLFSHLPEEMPSIVIVQHMLSQFTLAFADHLDEVSSLSVSEARQGDRLRPGEVLVAPGDKHCQVQKDHQGFYLTLDESPPVNHHRPSVDVFFYSMAKTVGEMGIGILLTGMGKDGARGLLAMREQGARTLAQDESTSTIFGMPQAAIKIGAAQEVVSLKDMPGWLIKMVSM